MPLRFIESFDHLSTATADDKWQLFTPTGAIGVGVGRNGTNAALNLTSSNRIAQSIATPNSTQWLLCGGAFRNRANASDAILSWNDASGLQLGFVIAQLSGAFTVWRGPSTNFGTQLGTTRPRLWHNDRWVYVEVRIRLDEAPNGAAYLYINGKEEFASTAIDTFPEAFIGYAPTQPWRQISFFCDGELDDVYAASEGGEVDASVVTVGDNPGDVHVENLMAVPDSVAAGFYRDFTPSAGSDHGALVDENLPGHDSDTTYNGAINTDEIDTYRYEPIAGITTGIIHGVQFNPTMRKTTIGTREVRNLTRPTTLNYANIPIGLSDAYLDNWECRETNPDTGVPWLIPEVDAGEWGVELRVASQSVPLEEGGPAPGAGTPPPDGAPPATPTRGVPSGSSIVNAYAAANPSELLNSCLAQGGTWDFMDGVLAALRAVDTNWGYNCKRGNCNDPSQDALAYYYGPGDPYDGATQTYVFDIITNHCPFSGVPTTNFSNVTGPNIVASWLLNRP